MPRQLESTLGKMPMGKQCKPVDITGMSSGAICDGDGADVFELLGQLENAQKFAKIDLEKLPYNVFLKV